MGFWEKLKIDNAAVWGQAVNHRFVNELFEAKVSDKVMATYLVQDYQFVDRFLSLLGVAVTTADTLSARLRFCRFLGMASSDENTYFERATQALGVPVVSNTGGTGNTTAVVDGPVTAQFKQLMSEAIAHRSYAGALAVIVVAESLYQEWAHRPGASLPGNFIYKEWITLHDNPDFNKFVSFLITEFDRVGPTEPDVATEYFARAVALEKEFFDAAYSA